MLAYDKSRYEIAYRGRRCRIHFSGDSDYGSLQMQQKDLARNGSSRNEILASSSFSLERGLVVQFYPLLPYTTWYEKTPPSDETIFSG